MWVVVCMLGVVVVVGWLYVCVCDLGSSCGW